MENGATLAHLVQHRLFVVVAVDANDRISDGINVARYKAPRWVQRIGRVSVGTVILA